MGPFECMVREGQILYIPEFWWHSILNVGDSIGIAVQSARYYTAWMQTVDKLQTFEEEKKKKEKYSDLEQDQINVQILNIHKVFDRMAPNCVVHTFFIGDENMRLQKLQNAEKYLSKAIKMDPTFIEGYVSLYKLYSESNQMEKAETVLRIAYVLNRHHPKIRPYLMEIFEKQKKYDLKRGVEMYQDLTSPKEHSVC